MKRLTYFSLLNAILKRSKCIAGHCGEFIACRLEYQLHNNIVRFLIAINFTEKQWQNNMSDEARKDLTESHNPNTSLNDPAIVSIFTSQNSAVIGNKAFNENPRCSSPLNVFNSQNSHSLINGRNYVPCFYRQTTPVPVIMPGRTRVLTYVRQVEEPPRKRACPTQEFLCIQPQVSRPNPQQYWYYPTPVPQVMVDESKRPHAIAGTSWPTAGMSLQPASLLSTQQLPTSTQERQVHSSSSASVREEHTQKPQKDISCLPRSWEYTTYGRKHSQHRKSGLEFTVMSYNVLSQSLVEKNLFLYRHCKEDVLNWDTRRRLLLEEFQAYDADILCLQEVECEHYTDFYHPTLRQLGYFGLFKKRTGTYNDGCATFYKKDKFEFEASAAVEYLKGHILDRDNVALVVKLKPISKYGYQSNRSICIANTHLLFNPRRGDVKLAQLMVLFAELDKLADKLNDGSNNYCSMILCGDFNSEPHSNIYNFTIEGFLQYEDLLVRKISGQSEGQHGRDVYLTKNFFSKALGISDDCKYFNRLKDNDGSDSANNTPGASGSTKPSMHSQGNTDSTSNQENDLKECDSNLATTEVVDNNHDDTDEQNVTHATGILQHRLDFVSVYKHAIERLNFREKEVTTQHSNADCTVDYIMYSVARKDTEFKHNKLRVRNVHEGPLRLLGRYGLLSSKEVGNLGGLPNNIMGSDHMSLLAKFLLK